MKKGMYIRGERIVFWGPNTNTNSIRPKKNTEYEYEYYSSIFFYRIRIRIIFVKNFPTNTNTNTIRQKISTEYEYEYYSVWKYHRIRIRIISYSNIFEYIPIYSNIFKHRIIPSLMKSHAKKLFEILAFFVTFFPWKKSGEQFNMTGTIGTLRTEVQLLVFRWFLAPRCSRNRPNTLKYRGLLEDTRTFSMRIYVESWNLDITQANAPSKSIQIEGSTNICLQLSTPSPHITSLLCEPVSIQNMFVAFQM